MFYAITLLKYSNHRWFGWSEKGTWGLNNEFGWKFDQNNFRYEFPDHENIGIDTLNKLVGAIVSILWQILSFRLMAEHKRPLVANFGIFSKFFYWLWKGAPIPFKWAYFEAPTPMLNLGSYGPWLVWRPFWILGCEKFSRNFCEVAPRQISSLWS